MDVLEALKSRHSIRAYTSEAVDRQTLNKVLEAANHSPSWANTQPWELYIAAGDPLKQLKELYLDIFNKGVSPNPEIPRPQSWPEQHAKRTFDMGAERFETMGIGRDDKEGRKKISERNFCFFDAPVVIFPCMDRDLNNWSLYDMGLYSQSLMLAARHYGLDTVAAVSMVGYPEIIRQVLSIPDNLNIVIGIALGYGDHTDIQNKYITKRRQVEEFTHISGLSE